MKIKKTFIFQYIGRCCQKQKQWLSLNSFFSFFCFYYDFLTDFLNHDLIGANIGICYIVTRCSTSMFSNIFILDLRIRLLKVKNDVTHIYYKHNNV
jgi:hypothetical protein